MQQGLNLRRSMRRTDYESVAFDHSAIHAAAILSIKIGNCKIVNFNLEIIVHKSLKEKTFEKILCCIE